MTKITTANMKNFWRDGGRGLVVHEEKKSRWTTWVLVYTP